MLAMAILILLNGYVIMIPTMERRLSGKRSVLMIPTMERKLSGRRSALMIPTVERTLSGKRSVSDIHK